MNLVNLTCYERESVSNDETDYRILIKEPFSAMVNIEQIAYITDISDSVVNDDRKFYQLRMSSDVCLVVDENGIQKIKRTKKRLD